MITIFTPTYNRAHTLTRLYESLKSQTLKQFEWIVIDDASTDKTEELIKSFIEKEKDFKIIYQKQEHGGKHRAINKAVKMAAYEWFFIVDSDDFLTEDAVEKVHIWIKENENDLSTAAVSGSRYNMETKEAMSIPDLLKLNPGLKCYNHQRYMYGLDRDKAEVYRTSVLKNYPFPEYENEFFCTEAVVWDAISADEYYISFYEDAIYKCQYLDDGLTKNDANGYIGSFNNFNGFLDYVKIQIKCHGLGTKTLGIITLALNIAKKKKISKEEIAKRLGLTFTVLNSFLKKYKKNFFQKIINKLYLKICK